jgi:4-hydroxybenzoate polyprenyltransferase
MTPRPADLARLVRAPAALSVPGDALAGAAAAGGADVRTAGLAASSVLLYWAGMAGNDWADRHVDATERPDRPIPSGRVSPRAALATATGLTALGLAAAGVAGGTRALAVAVPLAGCIWGYDLGAKGTATGPAVMAACRTLDVLLGGTRGRVRRAVPAALTVGAHTYLVTALSRREVSGAEPRLPAATLAGTGAVALTAVVGARGAAALTAALGLATAYAVRFGGPQLDAAAQPSPARIRSAVTAGVTGLPLLQAALAARSGARLTAALVALAAPVGRRLARLVSPT